MLPSKECGVALVRNPVHERTCCKRPCGKGTRTTMPNPIHCGLIASPEASVIDDCPKEANSAMASELAE
eukprot:15485517-Alexandrium_andersonii.AAC.1